MKISFYGGAGAVTGANYVVDSGSKKFIVDCGLHQGSKYAEDLNYTPLAYKASEVSAVFITHSHIDHVGRLPKLFKDGFRGVVYVTGATADIMRIALPDNMQHITREAEQEGHEPLFNQRDLDGVLDLVREVSYGEIIHLDDNVIARLHDAGHVLGSSVIEFEWKSSSDGVKKRVFFSGDLGNSPTPLLKQTEFIHDANYLVVESAYGDRVHEARPERRNKLARIIRETVQRRGVLMIPSFALERTQELLFELNELQKTHEIPVVPLFIDSPLAIKLTEVYEKHKNEFNADAINIMKSDDSLFSFPGLKITPTADDSKHINMIPAPKVIIAGSGMSQGGRILHHEKRYLSDQNNTIMFVGYQVDGSLGRKIQKGDKEVSIFGERIPVRCRVETLSGYSAHADQPALLHWINLANTNGSLKKVFVVQGEESASKTLANLVHDDLDIESIVPKTGETFELD